MTSEERQFLNGEITVSELPTITGGTYEAILDGVSPEEHDLYGDRWVWHWMFPGMHPDGGDFEIQVWTPPRISSTGMARDMAKALGADVSKGAKVHLGSLRGRKVQVVVVLDEEKGRNRIVGVTPLPAAAPASAAAIDPDFEAWKAERAAKQAAVEAANAEEPPPPSEPTGEEAA